MSSKLTKLLMGGALLAAMPATQAFADGTEAGTAVTNTFSLEFTVGGDTQVVTPDADDTVTFAVDRVVDLTVSVDNAAVVASPNDTVTQVFTVTNTGNSTQAYDLDFFQENNGVGTDTFDTEEPAPFLVTLRIDTDGDGVIDLTVPDFDLNDPTPDVAADGFIEVVVVTDVPAGQADGSVATVALEAITLEPATRPTSEVVLVGGVAQPGTGAPIGGAPGSEVVASTDPNGVGTVETVLGDDTGTGENVTGVTDIDADGDHSAASTITVQSATILADKSVDLISQDGSGCTLAQPPAVLSPAPASEQFLPNACVQYVISVENTGSATATSINIGDVLQGDLAYVTAAVVGPLGGTLNTATCGPSSTSCEVSLAGGELEAGETASLVILTTLK